MRPLKILYIPAGKKTFDVDTARNHMNEAKELLSSLTQELYHPEDILTSTDDVNSFLETVQDSGIDLIIYQSVTFADGEAIRAVIQKVNAPVVVWSVREPSTGTRLRLNSLTGGNSTSNVLRNAGHPFSFVFGNAEEAQVRKTIKTKAKVSLLLAHLQESKIGVIGEHPPGFFFADTNEEELQKTFGVSLHKIKLENAFEAARLVPAGASEKEVDRAGHQVIGFDRNDQTVQKFSQMTAYLREEIQQQNLSAMAIRCLPEFFTEFGAAACSTLSQLTEDGISSACETDIHGALTMDILHQLSGGAAPYLGDMVHVNEASNSVVFWHCGAGAYSLANPSQGAQAGVHPNRKVGMTMEFGLKPGNVTIFRVGYVQNEGFRLLVMKGEALDTPKRFNGTSVEVALNSPVSETVQKLMEEGYEPHYGLVYEDVTEELIELGKRLNLPVSVY